MAFLKQDRTQKCVLQKQQKQWSNKTAESVFPSRQVCATCLLRIRIWMPPPLPPHPSNCGMLPLAWHVACHPSNSGTAISKPPLISHQLPLAWYDMAMWRVPFHLPDGAVTLPTLACPSFPGIIMPLLSCHHHATAFLSSAPAFLAM